MQVALSIIIPVKDEGENIDILGNEINMAMENVTLPWECIWIDDGSTDTTVGELKKLSACDARHRLVILARNFGQSAALSVGFQNATGDILVTLDGDGQNDPADIPRLIEKLQKHGADMVNGVRQKRHDSFIRKISSRIANNFRDWVTGDSVTDVGCSVRVFKRECVKGIPVFKGMHRFLPTLVRMQGYTHIMESLVNHRPRVRGKTKYGIQNRLWVGLADLAAVKWMQSRLVFPEVQSMTSTTRREGDE